MPATPLVAAVTGSRGYLGSRICQTLESAGCQVISMARSPGQDRMRAVPYDLGSPVGAEAHDALRSADVLVHAAYDMSLTRQADIWRVNVAGTHRLLEAAREAEVGRLIVLSSMSAFPGTTQLYGRSKLDIEAMTIESGGCAIRPGLVYGKQSGGMAGALRKLSSLPVVPVIAGGAGVYTVREDDLMAVVARMASADILPSGVISVAHPDRVTLAELLKVFAAEEDHRPRTFSVPWQIVYGLLRSGEYLRLRLPFRADSLLGVVHAAPSLVGADQLIRLGITLRGFGSNGKT